MMGQTRFTTTIRPARAVLLAAAVAVAGVPAATVMLTSTPTAAQQILPADFFELVPAPAGRNIALSADTLVFDEPNNRVVATGNVGINFQGIRTTADRVIYDLGTGAVELVGNVSLIDQDGLEYVADRVELEGDFRTGFVEALTVAFPDGTHFLAARTELDDNQLRRVYDEATYSPCGTCIDDEGRRIGWQVRAVRIITDGGEQVIHFEEPRLELLGLPVLWLPYLTLPQGDDVEFPILGYRDEYGVRASFPFFNYRIGGGTLLLTPSLFSRQGAMLGAEWSQSLGDFSYEVAGSAIYQFDPGAYTGLANTEFRGALEASFTFTPTDEWTFGGEGLIFSDPAYLPNYDYRTGTARNQLYAEYFTAESFLDVRMQQFVPLTASGSDQANWDRYAVVRDRQALTFPNARGDHVAELPDGMGRATFEGSLLVLDRELDHGGSRGSTWGYAGSKAHGMGQASWSDHYTFGGALVSPYVGLRADVASFNGATGRTGVPDDQSRFTLTPIAALDIRYPVAIDAEGATTIVEPIAQLVYRGSDQSIPGITNDDAHGVVLDDTNLFSFDRFSGSDRQETGLRVNYGGQIQTVFDSGSWINLIGGHSIQLDGVNPFAVDDGTLTGLASGLDATHSYIVGGVSASFSPHLSGGGKVQFDPNRGAVQRALAVVEASYADIDIGLTYVYRSGDPFNARDRHEAAVEVGLPIADYWRATGGLAWDLSAEEFLQATAGIEYNDGYLAYGLSGRLTGPTHRTANDLRLMLNFRLSTAGNNEVLGFRQALDADVF